jgi:hypothetical protein
VEDWLKAISIDKVPDGLAWSTLSKMRNIMSLIYADAQRKRLIPDDVKYNPVRPPELGGARCKCESDYVALILTPKVGGRTAFCTRLSGCSSDCHLG